MIQRLQKHNFNLMLRIYYLEERLAAYTGGDGEPVSESELQEQVVELKVLIEERSQELEDRNVLLVKVRATLLCLPGPRSMAVTLCYHHVQARNAIESLQADLEFARLQVDEARSAAPSLAEVRATMVMARASLLHAHASAMVSCVRRFRTVSVWCLSCANPCGVLRLGNAL